MGVTHRPSLDPAVAEVRRAVRSLLIERAIGAEDSLVRPDAAPSQGLPPASQDESPPRIVVAFSGGADSMALLAATVFEASRRRVEVEAVTIDHGLQAASRVVAERAAAVAAMLGARPSVVRVEVAGGDGPEAAARDARYAALREHARGAAVVLLGHTLDDQAETVLLGLARGAGAGSLAGMPRVRTDDDGTVWARPLLGVHRATTRAACAAEALDPWNDPHNEDRRFSRVRVREAVLPVLEEELGPGIADALARTAEQLREDNEAFAQMIDETIEDIVEPAEAGIAVSVPALAANPAAVRHRIIRHVVQSEFHVGLTRNQTLEVARLAVDWAGQGPIDLPRCTASRVAGRILFTAREQA